MIMTPEGISSVSGVKRIDVDAVNTAGQRNFYKARAPIYPKRVHGRYRRLKWLIMAATLGVYYFVPWIRWPRGPNEPDQAVLIDFPGSRFYFFSIEIWPDELYYVTGLLILAALGLFFATALFGRVWCGYSCPQTVWTDLYIAVERMIEGDRNKRIKLDRSRWTFDKFRKKITKHILWILIGMATGGAWIFYFHDAPTIAAKFFTGEAPFTAYFYCGLLTLTTYIFAGSLREQVCTYMCPWPRIQAALTDEETLQVTYKSDRGEPRGPHKTGETWDGRGDCVSCRACVAACPMGIDIRDGAQLECINCALCIDACDEIMKKVARPPGLIEYDTDANIERRSKGEKPQINFVRGRTAFYAALLAIVAAIMAVTLFSRPTITLGVERDRTPPYVLLSDGSIQNAFTIKVVNRDNFPRQFQLAIEGPAAFEISSAGGAISEDGNMIELSGDEVRELRVFVTLSAQSVARVQTIPVTVSVQDAASGELSTAETVFVTGNR